MQDIYGHKWISAFGESDIDGTWSIALGDLTPEELGRGLRACVERDDPWPPSLPEFRRLCRPPKRENEAMYRYSGPMLPHLLSPEQRAEGRANVAALRAKLQGEPV